MTVKELISVAQVLEVDYLSSPSAFPGSFPVVGEIDGLNERLMVRRGKDSKAVNVIFLIDTACPNTSLSYKAMENLYFGFTI